jgi:hypothetical protein
MYERVVGGLFCNLIWQIFGQSKRERPQKCGLDGSLSQMRFICDLTQVFRTACSAFNYDIDFSTYQD